MPVRGLRRVAARVPLGRVHIGEGPGIRSPSVLCGATGRNFSTRVGAHNVTVPTGVPDSIAPGAVLSMTADLDPAPPDPPPERSAGRPWVRPVVLVLSCLVIGFVGGWIWRGDAGPTTVIPPAAPADTGDTGSVTTGGGGTTTRATPPATSTAEQPVLPPERSAISLAVLNGTSRAGYAADVAGQAEGLGYTGVVTGNAPSASVSKVYFRSGRRPAAERVAKDLLIDAVAALPGGALSSAAPSGAEVIVVLGTG